MLKKSDYDECMRLLMSDAHGWIKLNWVEKESVEGLAESYVKKADVERGDYNFFKKTKEKYKK